MSCGCRGVGLDYVLCRSERWGVGCLVFCCDGGVGDGDLKRSDVMVVYQYRSMVCSDDGFLYGRVGLVVVFALGYSGLY